MVVSGSCQRTAVRDYPESVAAPLQFTRLLARGRLQGDAARHAACQYYRLALERWPALAPARVEAAALGCLIDGAR